MVSSIENLEKIIDSIIEYGNNKLNENIPFKQIRSSPEYDSLTKSLLEEIEKNDEFNQLFECLTQNDIEELDDVEFKPYHHLIPKYKSLVYKSIELLLQSTKQDDESFFKRTLRIQEEIKNKFD